MCVIIIVKYTAYAALVKHDKKLLIRRFVLCDTNAIVKCYIVSFLAS